MKLKLIISFLLLSGLFATGQSLKKQLMHGWLLDQNNISCLDSCCYDLSFNEDTLNFISCYNLSDIPYDEIENRPILFYKFRKGKKLHKIQISQYCDIKKEEITIHWKLNDKIKILSIGKDKHHMRDYIISYYDTDELKLIAI